MTFQSFDLRTFLQRIQNFEFSQRSVYLHVKKIQKKISIEEGKRSQSYETVNI